MMLIWWALRKPGVEEWLVKTAQLMYWKAQSHIRIKETFSDDFLVHLRLNQGSASFINYHSPGATI